MALSRLLNEGRSRSIRCVLTTWLAHLIITIHICIIGPGLPLTTSANMSPFLAVLACLSLCLVQVHAQNETILKGITVLVSHLTSCLPLMFINHP